jgi:hypothetical protein
MPLALPKVGEPFISMSGLGEHGSNVVLLVIERVSFRNQCLIYGYGSKPLSGETGGEENAA